MLFTPHDVQRFLGRSKIAARFLLHRLKQNGAITSVKRGIYTLTDTEIPDPYLANKIYAPSYVSLEYALSYHQVIPEVVYEITSVTTKITRQFETGGKLFTYRKIQRDAFTGYSVEKQKGVSFQIADPEKAFVDTQYFRLHDGLKPLLRFQKEKIHRAKALRYAECFHNARLLDILQTTLR